MRPRRGTGLAAVLVGLAFFPLAARADITIEYQTSQPGNNFGILQSVAFPAKGGFSSTGTTIVGDVNTPQNTPYYRVDAISHDTPAVTFDGSGQTITNNANSGNGTGFNKIEITPEAGSGIFWTYMDFKLDSLNTQQPVGTPGLTISVTDTNGKVWTQALNFPWEGNGGTNQQYEIIATNGEAFSHVNLSYTDPLTGGNQIHSMENIDVVSVPEPGSLALIVLGGSLGLAVRRRLLRK